MLAVLHALNAITPALAFDGHPSIHHAALTRICSYHDTRKDFSPMRSDACARPVKPLPLVRSQMYFVLVEPSAMDDRAQVPPLRGVTTDYLIDERADNWVRTSP